MTTYKIEKSDESTFEGMFMVWHNIDNITLVRATGIEISIHNNFMRVALTVGKKKKTEIVVFFVRADEGNCLKIDESAKKYVTMVNHCDGATPLIREDSKN